jgi:uncharacterized protein
MNSIYGIPAIDCDVHITLPETGTLFPFLEDYWKEALTVRGMSKTSLNLASYPPNTPLAARPDWKASIAGAPTQLAALKTNVLDAFGSEIAICNCLYGVNAIHSEDMALALCRALNTWMRQEWLDAEPRLRASIVVPIEAPDAAAEEIERCAQDSRFVQVLMLSMGEMPLGKRYYWPIYKAAEKHGLPIGIHAGSTGRHPLTPAGWPSYYLEDYVNNSQAMETQVLSFIAEGVFDRFPGLKVVCIEGGSTWLPGLIWRANKTWRGVRAEVPWIKRAPAEILRDHVRFTLQPFDAPPSEEQLNILIDQFGSDRLLLFSTDYPHWHFDGTNALPPGLSKSLQSRILFENAIETYPKISLSVAQKELVQ